ncbi:YdcF family protein [Phyllobacterium myrsinacearum]|uniref:DUF218 domain-containing protein n=1 Tax=Phyllobacterium myrsinacearum TaxID=28101 RepID=A0A2S9JFS7_9HYPH|nr:YdcF family protein [Phyllobacterium myrsinacearum]PRD51756.1 hypothetical protein C5750_18110 [Phyllobacterium myrsinacearum]PWV86320.1 uncharacterized SAM-binding protein YcdF (DUF218 family) [Phyllobacterium myrsinacearum]RZV00045.1 uncharacterized SAM-binding protein YcdF (DUF218 family) [Phyllobacterium myrsinacearum]
MTPVPAPISKRKGGRPVRRWRFTAVLFLGLCALSSYPLAILFANTLLSARSPATQADIIVILGGDGPARAAQAARLWQAGMAQKILITGDGDCYWIRKSLIDFGVGAGSITVECQSRNTWENALFSSPILQRMQVRKAILVTSWFHSRRALNSFRQIAFNIQWQSVPVEPDVPIWRIAVEQDGVQIFKEYPKSLWYMLRASLWKDHGERDARTFAAGMLA